MDLVFILCVFFCLLLGILSLDYETWIGFDLKIYCFLIRVFVVCLRICVLNDVLFYKLSEVSCDLCLLNFVRSAGTSHYLLVFDYCFRYVNDA